ncbi:MAG: hypothetical protein VYA53_02405 [Acidobacteriota bacterium]|jgi:tetratricopeptide (TPR) repeat protein|nr:hypothetical protein [Acidobacteriota bacterium]
MRRTLLLLSATLLTLTLGASIQEVEGSADLEGKLRSAASQHEIIKLLLDEDRYAEVLSEFWTILDLELTGDNEKPVVQEAWMIVERMRESGEYDLAHQIVDGASNELETSESTFYLLMLKGKLFQDQGRTEEALEAYREAQLYKDD